MRRSLEHACNRVLALDENEGDGDGGTFEEANSLGHEAKTVYFIARCLGGREGNTTFPFGLLNPI